MRYEGKIFRPPSEARSYILQATIGCSWNHCTYCDMYRDKEYRVRALDETLADLRAAARVHAGDFDRIFVADGDALGLAMDHWLPILGEARALVPGLRQVSCYATAKNVLAKSAAELRALAEAGLGLIYIGPESGDDVTLKAIAKGATHAEHVAAAAAAHAAGIGVSVIVLLGVAGTARSREHAEATGDLLTAMDPEFIGALTTTIVPQTPLHTLAGRGRFTLPSVAAMLGELRTIVDRAAPRDAVFRTNHASNYLPLGGRLPADRRRIVATIDDALAGAISLRPEWMRGL